MTRAIPMAMTFIAFSASNVFGGPVFVHTGNSDPTSEGWVQSGPGPGTSAGPVTNDLGLGINAWNVNDASSAGGSSLGYEQVPSVSQISDAASAGWRLSTIVRILNGSDTPDSGVFLEYSTGSTTFSMDFGSDADSDPIVVLRTGFDGTMSLGPSFTLEGAGSTYHQFDLIFDPIAGSADLFVDGIERISNYTGVSPGSGVARVIWGGVGSVTQGNANYHTAEWAIVPEPVTGVLLAMGGLGLRRRRSRTGG